MKILLAITGSISAYKACNLTSVLDTLGHEVQCVMTDNAQEFISKMSLSALSHNSVLTNKNEWSCEDGKIPHIYYTQDWEPDVFIIVPSTINTIAKIAFGLGGEIVSCMALAAPKELPKIICPAANTHMYLNSATQKNIHTLRERGCIIVEPVTGKLACGTEGIGKLPSTRTIVEIIEKYGKS